MLSKMRNKPPMVQAVRDRLFQAVMPRITQYNDYGDTWARNELRPYILHDLVDIVMQYTDHPIVCSDWHADRLVVLLHDNTIFMAHTDVDNIPSFKFDANNAFEPRVEFDEHSLGLFLRNTLESLVCDEHPEEDVTRNKKRKHEKPCFSTTVTQVVIGLSDKLVAHTIESFQKITNQLTPSHSLHVNIDRTCGCCTVWCDGRVVHVSPNQTVLSTEHIAYHDTCIRNKRLATFRQYEKQVNLVLYPDKFTLGCETYQYQIPTPLQLLIETRDHGMYCLAGDRRLYFDNVGDFFEMKDVMSFRSQWALVSMALPGSTTTDYQAVLFTNEKHHWYVLLVLVNNRLYGQLLVSERGIIADIQFVNGVEHVLFDDKTLLAENVTAMYACPHGAILHKGIGFKSHPGSFWNIFYDASLCAIIS